MVDFDQRFDLQRVLPRRSLVFGGGHVVLPLLETAVGDTIGGDRFRRVMPLPKLCLGLCSHLRPF